MPLPQQAKQEYGKKICDSVTVSQTEEDSKER